VNKLHYICPICENIPVYRKSESGLIGACARCRDKLIPEHIPLKQHKTFIKQYIKQYIKERI
jgi:hypothetical protein